MNMRLLPPLLGLAALLAACGSTTDKPAAATTTITAAKATATATAKTVKGPKRSDADNDGIPDPVTVKGKLGDKLALAGSGLNDKDLNDHTKTQIRITLQSMRGPFKGYDVAANRKLIGVVLKIANVGKLLYDDPRPDGTLTLAGGETGKQTSLIQLSGKNPCNDPSVKLKTGQSRSVCIAFEVPKTGKPQAFQYVSDAGYGDTGLWSLG